MISAIKMDFYRMFHTKSFYIIWIVLAAAVWFSTAMSREDYKMMQQERTAQTSQVQQSEPVNLGMSVTLPTKAGEQVTLLDQVYANMQGKFITLFLVIFAVMFSTADIKSGYVKNIGGQIRRRWYLILSKSMVLIIYTAVTMIFYLLIQAVFQRIYFGSLILGPADDFWMYFGIQCLLNAAMVLICMAAAIIIRSNVFSMTLAVCMCMNVLIILYSGIDKIMSRMGMEDFWMLSHTVTGKIALLPMNPGSHDSSMAALTALAFGAVSVIAACMVFQKRDIR